MGAKHSSSPALSLATATEDQATALPADRFHRYSLNFPRLVIGRRQCQSSHRKMKSKRNVSATFTVNEFEIPYDSQESNPQSCISSMSSTQNVFSSASSVSNGSPAVAAAAAAASSDSNRLCRFVGGEFNRENLLLNINAATEEGLMTLPGVTRQTARNIVSYRKLIGGFKNIQDIALVSGVGASLYVRFKSDITCHGLTSDLQDHHQQQQRLTSSVASERRSKSSTLSKHSSTSSSGIDIATINEDDDNNDCNKIAHQRNHHQQQHHHHHHHNNNNNNNNDDDNKASTVYENHVIVNSDTNIGRAISVKHATSGIGLHPNDE